MKLNNHSLHQSSGGGGEGEREAAELARYF